MRVRGETKVKNCLRGPPLEVLLWLSERGRRREEVEAREEEGAKVDYELTHRLCSSISSLTRAGKGPAQACIGRDATEKTRRY
jgi:16S rRNA C1402 (ribose-2'-O) methylase RsmI